VRGCCQRALRGRPCRTVQRGRRRRLCGSSSTRPSVRHGRCGGCRWGGLDGRGSSRSHRDSGRFLVSTVVRNTLDPAQALGA
jgi:hypothetical protein